MRQGVLQHLLRYVGIERSAGAQQRNAAPCRLSLLSHPVNRLFHTLRNLLGMEHRFYVQFVKDLRRIQHIAGLVRSKLLQDDREFLFQHFPDTILNGGFQHQV